MADLFCQRDNLPLNKYGELRFNNLNNSKWPHFIWNHFKAGSYLQSPKVLILKKCRSWVPNQLQILKEKIFLKFSIQRCCLHHYQETKKLKNWIRKKPSWKRVSIKNGLMELKIPNSIQGILSNSTMSWIPSVLKKEREIMKIFNQIIHLIVNK